MDTKFVIFMFLGTFLLMMIYSSSTSQVFAKITFACSTLPDKSAYYCANSKTKEIIICLKTKRGYDCEYAPKRTTDTNLPPDLSNSLDTLTKNTTKVPNTDILNGNSLLADNNNNGNSTGNGNVKEPKAPKIPNDLGN